jgi:hypothetical protein
MSSFPEAFTVGTDVSIDIYDPQDGSFTSITGITDFNARPMTQDLEHHGLEGKDAFATIYRGWEITAGYDRMDGKTDRYFAEREARYRSGLPQQTVTITQTITERDGSQSQYRFSGVEMKQDETGTYNREDKVTGRITARGTRTRVA